MQIIVIIEKLYFYNKCNYMSKCEVIRDKMEKKNDITNKE